METLCKKVSKKTIVRVQSIRDMVRKVGERELARNLMNILANL